MAELDQKRSNALRKAYKKRTIEDWVVILYCIYQNHNRTCSSHELWLQVVNDASQLAETIRRQIIRTKVSTEFNVYTQIARLFSRISAFIGRHIYDTQHPSSLIEPLASLLHEKPLDDHIGGEERYEKWILLKYPYACPACGNRPCVCAAYRNIMENRELAEYDEFWRTNSGVFMEHKKKFSAIRGDLSQDTIRMYNASIDEWVNMFKAIYASGHIEVSLESVGFHFLEEVGEVSDGILLLDELHKNSQKTGVYHDARINLHRTIVERASQEPKYRRFMNEYRKKIPKNRKERNALQSLLRINMSLTKEELADVFSWICAVLNKIMSASEYWNPEGQFKTISDALHERYLTRDGTVGCSYCSQAICARDCLIKSAVRKSVGKRNQKLEHRLFS